MRWKRSPGLIKSLHYLADDTRCFQYLIFLDYQRRSQAYDIAMRRFSEQSAFHKTDADIPGSASIFGGAYYNGIQQPFTTHSFEVSRFNFSQLITEELTHFHRIL